jgi:hypothetical protein
VKLKRGSARDEFFKFIAGTDPPLEQGPEGAESLVRAHAATRGALETFWFGHRSNAWVEHQEGISSAMSRRAWRWG